MIISPEWLLFVIVFIMLNVGFVIGFKVGRAYGRNLGWHMGYQAAQAFYRMKLSHERYEPPSRRR